MTLNKFYVPTCLIEKILRKIYFGKYRPEIFVAEKDLEARETDTGKSSGFSKDSRSLPEIIKVRILSPEKFTVKSVADLREVEGSRESISRTNRWTPRYFWQRIRLLHFRWHHATSFSK